MSRTPYEATDMPNAGLGSNQYPPQSVQNQASQGESDLVDGSGPILSMYLEMATEEDRKMVETWKADADGILIFTGLFSTSVASLISVSIQDIRPNPQDTSNFYLANIYQTVADSNRSDISSTLPTSPPPFSPPNYAVWMNGLWFLSLVISLTCALLATLLQQWARRYLKVTQPRYSPHKRARIRAFFFEGVEKYLLPWVVDALPTLLHVSLFLFFAGLVVFLSDINLSIFKLVLSWVGICTAVYGCITFIPIFLHDSPYYTPLTSLVWPIVIGTSHVIFRVLWWLTGFVWCSGETSDRFLYLQNRYGKLLLQGMLKTAEETALNLPSEIDTRAFLWTFDTLDEDHELERFFSGLPGFRSSKVVDDPLPSLTYGQKLKLFDALIGLSDRTFSSDLLPEPVKNRRTIICAKAIDPADIPGAYQLTLSRIVSDDQHGGLGTTEFGRVMRGWSEGGDRETTLVKQAIFANVIARAQQHDDHWFSITSEVLGVPESILRDHATHGDSLSLAILIHVTRQQFSHFWKRSWPRFEFTKVLETASNFNAEGTSPDLQHEFCALWNQIVREAQTSDYKSMAWCLLKCIRNVYVTLHHGTEAAPTQFSASTSDLGLILFEPSSYPLCNVTSHHPGSTAHIHNVSVDAPSSSIPTLSASDDLKDEQLLDHTMSAPVSVLSICRTALEGHHIHPTPSDTVTAHATQGSIDTLAITVPISTPEPSASKSPPTSIASTPDVIAVQHSAYHRTPSDVLDVPSSPTLTPDSRSSVLAPAASCPPRSQLSPEPPDPAATAEEGRAKAGFRKEMDAPCPSSAIRGDIMAPDIPPQSPSLPPISDVAIAGLSWYSLDTEHSEDHPPYPSYGQYDIV